MVPLKFQVPADAVPTGWAALDAALPGGGWPASALSEVLLPADGVGELRLVWPALARLARGDGVIAVVAPPYRPYAPAWEAAGIRAEALQVIEASPRDALWASEQCLRSGACRAVLCWPQKADDRALRRLQVAAETGRTPGFAFRPMQAGTYDGTLMVLSDAAGKPMAEITLEGRGIVAGADESGGCDADHGSLSLS